MAKTDAGRQLAAHAVGVDVLRRAQEVLAQVQIPVLPLKGIWLQGRVYDPDYSRLITDVDVLVPEGRYGAAVDCLLAAGFKVTNQATTEVSLALDGLPLPLDLHRDLFTRGAFQMPTAEVFARATPGGRLFDVPVWEPDPLDVFAHLVGHFVKARMGPGNSMHLGDFVHCAEALDLDPEACATHLARCGMARAARYALPLAHAQAPEGNWFCPQVLRALGPDRAGDMLARIGGGLLAGRGRATTLGALAGFLLDRSLSSGVRSMLWRAADLGAQRLKGR